MPLKLGTRTRFMWQQSEIAFSVCAVSIVHFFTVEDSKMKKIVSLFLIIVACASLMLASASCSTKHPLVAFQEKMEKADSYQITVTMSDVPLFGTFTMTTQVDGNIQYTPAVLFSEEEYTETVDGVKYTYTKDDSGKWTKEKDETTDDDSSVWVDESMQQLFNPDNFEKVKGEENTFVQKSDVTFDDYEDVKITITDDSCTMEMKTTSEGVTYGIKIVISKIGEIELTLPEVN